MAYRIESQYIVDNNTVIFKVYKPGDKNTVYSFTVSDPNSLTMIDPKVGQTAERSIIKYLNSLTNLFSTSDTTYAQGQISVIEQRAKNYNDSRAGKNNIAGYKIPAEAADTDSNRFYSGADLQREDLITVAAAGENAGSIVDVTKNFFSYGNENKSGGQGKINVGQGGNYFDTIGGADLSVFYLTEVPAMEDVLDKTLSPDAWRKELIVTEMDNVLSISYSTIREKFPVRRLGDANPIVYTSGPRTIGGHIGFAVFVEDVLTRMRSQVRNSFKKAYDSILKNTQGIVQKASTDEYVARRVSSFENYYQASLNLDGAQLLDSIPPFHLLVMGVNERGQFSKFIVKGVQIVDENQYQGTTNPHIINKVTYVASDIVPMSTFDGDPSSITGSLGSLAERLESTAFGMLNGLPNFAGSDLLKSAKKDLDKITKNF